MDALHRLGEQLRDRQLLDRHLTHPTARGDARVRRVEGELEVGQLAGNHFATITEGQEKLPEIGRLTLWEGAQEITIEEVR